MNACEETRLRLLDYRRGRLQPPADETVRAHLDRCEDCAREDAAEQALTEVLERRLPQHPAPIWLKRRLAAAHPAPSPVRFRRRLRHALATAGLVVAVAAAVVIVRPVAPPVVDAVRSRARPSTTTCGSSSPGGHWRSRATTSTACAPGSRGGWTSRRS